MKHITHRDACTIGSAVDEVRVSVTFRGGTTGVFDVEQDGVSMPADVDGTVPIGRVNTLPGTSILVTVTVNQISGSRFFEVDFVLQGTTCGPFTVQNTFADGDPVAEVSETIRFR